MGSPLPNKALQLAALRFANATVFAVRSRLVMRTSMALNRAAAERPIRWAAERRSR